MMLWSITLEVANCYSYKCHIAGLLFFCIYYFPWCMYVHTQCYRNMFQYLAHWGCPKDDLGWSSSYFFKLIGRDNTSTKTTTGVAIIDVSHLHVIYRSLSPPSTKTTSQGTQVPATCLLIPSQKSAKFANQQNHKIWQMGFYGLRSWPDLPPNKDFGDTSLKKTNNLWLLGNAFWRI